MTHSPQVRMANEIALQFRHRPPEEAATEIATHIRTFWAPTMRTDLLAHIQSCPTDLDPLVLAAAPHLTS